ncbi:YdiU family protein [Rossellomorea marisflavi]|uniref:protein adenylyltransferase SelO n=1 Tax=Rossellomorea marisflavi TaxID=189381 RepID=UPI00203E0F7D|nr:YdiU family protein [Rossellomorea marisflavi]MCM2605738.1 YdiU family protein [Rossellomorea marisflavi]
MTNQSGWKLENTYEGLPPFFYSSMKPVPVKNPEWVLFNEELATSLGITDQDVAVYAGNRVPEGGHPLSQAYGGHQFGYFNRLGDGRAVLLGEQVTPEGTRVDIQLKGAGRTPYSRGGDGRASLGPMLREYVISEAMHALGIPTTRSLAVVKTGEDIVRDRILEGAVLTRVASSHIRVGTFQLAAKAGSLEDLRSLADYTIDRHYPGVKGTDQPYLSLLEQVMDAQASLIAKWQLVGFIHGVMNTDNMAISGETIDYGPCAFMDAFNPETVFSSIDEQGRYAYGNQPPIAGWNVARFAESLLPLLDENEEKAVELAQETISTYPALYHSYWLDGMRSKLGLFHPHESDQKLVEDLLTMMGNHGADYTNTFLDLTHDREERNPLAGTVEFAQWQERWEERLDEQPESEAEARKLMRDHNPAVIPRNHQVERALDAAVEDGDLSVLTTLLHVLKTPYDHEGSPGAYQQPQDPEDGPYRTFCGT